MNDLLYCLLYLWPWRHNLMRLGLWDLLKSRLNHFLRGTTEYWLRWWLKWRLKWWLRWRLNCRLLGSLRYRLWDYLTEWLVKLLRLLRLMKFLRMLRVLRLLRYSLRLMRYSLRRTLYLNCPVFWTTCPYNSGGNRINAGLCRLCRLKRVGLTHLRCPINNLALMTQCHFNILRYCDRLDFTIVIVEFYDHIFLLGTWSWDKSIFMVPIWVDIWHHLWLYISSEGDFILSDYFLRSGRHESILPVIIDLNFWNIRTELWCCFSIISSQRLTSCLNITSTWLLIQLMIGSIEHIIALYTSFVSLTLI